MFYSHECFVSLVERKHSRLRPQADARCQVKKVTRISASHVRNATNLPLAPKQRVVIELRDTIQMDSIDRHHAALAQRGERCDHHVTTGRKGDRTIEFHWRLLCFGADPRGSK